MVRAADAWARGHTHRPPASLRVYNLARTLKGAMPLDPLNDSWELFRELECYAAAEAAERARQERKAARSRSRAGRHR